MLWIVLTVYAVISMIAIYRFEIAWNYCMHLKFPNVCSVVEPLSEGQYVSVLFSIIPIISITFLGCNVLAPYSFNLKYKEFFWGFLFAKPGINYNN